MRPRHVLPGLLGALVMAGCAAPDTVVQTAASTSTTHNIQVSETFQAGAGAAITYDQSSVPAGARGAVQSRFTITSPINALAPAASETSIRCR